MIFISNFDTLFGWEDLDDDGKRERENHFLYYFVGREKGSETNTAQVFYSQAYQNTFFPNWGEMWRENANTKMSSILDKTIPVQHRFFFFFSSSSFNVSLLDCILQQVGPK